MDNNLQQSPSTVRKDIFVMIGEIVILCVIFLFSLILLNYFHILNIGKSFTFLSFLPQKTQQALQTKKVSPIALYYATVTNFDLETFAKETLMESYLPLNLSPQQMKNPDPHSISTIYFDSWDKNKNAIGIQMDYQKSTNHIQLFLISIIVPIDFTPTAAASYQLLKKYFLSVPSMDTFTCSKKNISTPNNTEIDFCQSFSATSSEKTGFVVSVTKTTPVRTQLITCKIPQSNINYANINTCIEF